MRIIVTGSDGYIGKGVVERLLELGHEVVAYGLQSCGLKHVLLEEHQVNIFSLDSQQLSSHDADAVLHLAWRNGFKHNDPCHIDDLPSHYRFLKSCVEAGIQRIACMGTMHEVGYHEGPVRADTPCWPTTPYAISKNALRELMIEICRETDSVDFLWLRGFYLVSSDERGNSIFSKIAEASKAGKKSFPFTRGQNQYDFMDYEDFCKLTAAYLVSDITGIVNVCSGVPETLASRVERYIVENEFDIELDYGAFPDRPYDSPAIWGDRSCGGEL